jgi:hypothetical protein
VYWIKIKEVETGKETTLEFENKEVAKLYRDYHCRFHAWDKRESWIAERFLLPEHKQFVVAEKEETKLNKNKEEVTTKYFKIKPKTIILEDNLGLKREALMWEALRSDRNEALDATDWTQIADCALDSKVRQLYREYRQYLRNLPLSYNDSTIEQYKIMDFSTWREFFKK